MAATQVRFRSGLTNDKHGMSIRHLPVRRTALRFLSQVLGTCWMLSGTAQAQPLSLQQTLDAAAANWEVALSKRNLQAAQADVVAANRAPLPVLSAKTSQIDLQHGIGGGGLWQNKRIDKSLGLDWTWERGDKRLLRTQSSESLVTASQRDLQDTVTQQHLNALALYYDWMTQHERLRAVQSIADSASQLARSAVLREKAGDLSAQDAARIQIEAHRAIADVRTAELALETAALGLAQITKLQGNPLAWQPASPWPTLKSSQSMAQASNPLEAWVDQRPAVMAAQARVTAAQASLSLALAQKKSDITWGGSADHFPGTSNRLLELRMQMPLQWGYGYEGEIARADALYQQAQEWLEKTRLSARTELLTLVQAWQSASARAASYDKDILPQAVRVAGQAELAYSKGALSLTDLLDARRTLRATQLEALDARNAHARTWGALLLLTRPASETALVLSQ
jgi:cobalt-zinc-cadmium efflux system outer membrane protein